MDVQSVNEEVKQKLQESGVTLLKRLENLEKWMQILIEIHLAKGDLTLKPGEVKKTVPDEMIAKQGLQ